MENDRVWRANGYRGSFGDYVLELDSDDGCTAL